nr:MAG TPA: FAM76 protein [Caudoviricetes sp.]
MQIGDLEKWSVDQLKIEVVRLSEACEKKQHEILDKNEKINELQAELDKMCDYNDDLKRQISEKADVPFYDESAEIAKYRRQHQDDCITINQLHTTLDVLVDRYANLRKIHGLS